MVADLLFLVWLLTAERRRFAAVAVVLHGLVGALAAFALVWPFARYYFILHSEPPASAPRLSADLIGWFVPPENTWMGQWLLAHHVKGPRWIWGEVTVYLGWTTLGSRRGRRGGLAAEPRRAGAPRRFSSSSVSSPPLLALGPSPREVASGSFGWSPFGILAHMPGVEPVQDSGPLLRAHEPRARPARGDGLRALHADSGGPAAR